MRRAAAVLGLALALGATGSACSHADRAPATLALADYTRPASAFDAPFPSEDLRRPDGHVALDGLAAMDAATALRQARALLTRDARGFSQTAAAFFAFSAPLAEPALADPAASLAPGAPIALVDVDRASPAFGARAPFTASFMEDGGPYGVPNMLAVLPYQGVPLLPGTLYAAIVTRGVKDAAGRAVGPSDATRALLAGGAPAGLAGPALDAYRGALDALDALHLPGLARGDVAALAVFRTDAPFAQDGTSGLGPAWSAPMDAVKADALARLPPLDAPLARTDTFPSFCVYASTIAMPVYQSGAPPYKDDGGQWLFDPAGKPVFQRSERARVVVTVPRTAAPTGGLPAVVFARTGAGGDRPLVDRGVQAKTGGPAVTPGTGPALEFARVGFGAISIDGPLGGLRNPTGDDEDFLIFNVANPGAIRDNVRQSAIELTLAAHVLDALAVDTSDCPGAPATTRFDTTKLALFAHSMGATIAPLALAFEPRFGAAVLSGEGGSWIDNVLYKELPLAVRPLAELLIGYTTKKRALTEGDPALSLVQWAAEAADPPLYGARVVHAPADGARRSVLMVQGIVDHYILPPMANASSLAFGLDLAGDALDTGPAELAPFAPLARVLPLSGRAQIALPASGNVTLAGGARVTAVVVQHAADGVEDGHEVIFQRPEPKYQYRCFLASYAAGGAPRVPAPLASDGACP